MDTILQAVGVLGIAGMVLASVLYLVLRKFAVKEDPRLAKVNAVLPGANCGGCGFPGCDAMASACVKAADKGSLEGLLCPVGGKAVMDKIADALGMESVGGDAVAVGGHRLRERVGDCPVRDCRILDRRILPAGTLHPDGAVRDHQIAPEDMFLHASAGAHTDKGMGAALCQFCQRDRGRGSPDAGGCHTDSHAVQCSCVSNEFPDVRDLYRIVKMRGDLRAALRVSRHDHIFPDIFRPDAGMILFSRSFRIIDHRSLLPRCFCRRFCL